MQGQTILQFSFGTRDEKFVLRVIVFFSWIHYLCVENQKNNNMEILKESIKEVVAGLSGHRLVKPDKTAEELLQEQTDEQVQVTIKKVVSHIY